MFTESVGTRLARDEAASVGQTYRVILLREQARLQQMIIASVGDSMFVRKHM
jgi:serine/threonine protein phosphatase PrpC